jgi:DnaJ-class molecular chaperone
MENLTRYSPAILNNNGVAEASMCPTNVGAYVKFSDIKELLQTSHNKPSAPCPNCNGRGVGSHNSDGLPNTCLVCHGTGTAHVG